MTAVDKTLVRQERDVLHAIIERQGTLAELSYAYVRYALACHGGNKVHAADQISIDRRTIQRWSNKGHL